MLLVDVYMLVLRKAVCCLYILLVNERAGFTRPARVVSHVVYLHILIVLYSESLDNDEVNRVDDQKHHTRHRVE